MRDEDALHDEHWAPARDVGALGLAALAVLALLARLF